MDERKERELGKRGGGEGRVKWETEKERAMGREERLKRDRDYK